MALSDTARRRYLEESKGTTDVINVGGNVYSQGREYTQDEWARQRDQQRTDAAGQLQRAGLAQADAGRFAGSFSAEVARGRDPNEVARNIGATVGGRAYEQELNRMTGTGVARNDAAAQLRATLGGMAPNVALAPRIQPGAFASPTQPTGGATGLGTPQEQLGGVVAGQTQGQGGEFPRTLAELFANPDKYSRYVESARQILAAKYNPQIQALEQQQGQMRLTGQQSRSELLGEIEPQQEAVLRAANRRGTALWGTTTDAQARVASSALEQSARSQEQERLAAQQLSERIGGLRQDQAALVQPEAERMFREDRNFIEGARRFDVRQTFDERKFTEDTRQFGMEYAIQAADAELRQTRGYGLLASELAQAEAGASVATGTVDSRIRASEAAATQAETTVDRAQQLLPYEVEAARLSNISRELTNQGAQITNQAANEALYRDIQEFGKYGLLPQQLDVEAKQIQNELARLERDIATDPQYGKLAEAQARIQKIHADIATLSTKTQKDDGFTAWQQYQVLRDQLSDQRYTADQRKKAEADAEKARTSLVTTYTREWAVNQPAADVWVDFMDLISTPKSDGTMPTAEDAANVVQTLSRKPGLTASDREWLSLMHDSWRGNTNADADLKTRFRRSNETRPILQIGG